MKVDQKLRELVDRAWRDANGDALSAIKLMRDRTPGLGLRRAAELVAELKHVGFIERQLGVAEIAAAGFGDVLSKQSLN